MQAETLFRLEDTTTGRAEHLDDIARYYQGSTIAVSPNLDNKSTQIKTTLGSHQEPNLLELLSSFSRHLQSTQESATLYSLTEELTKHLWSCFSTISLDTSNDIKSLQYEEVFDEITPSARNLICSSLKTCQSIFEIGDSLRASLTKRNVLKPNVILDSPTDPELPGWSALKIIIRIQDRSYKDILQLWDEISEDIYRDIDPEIAKNVFLSFESV